jgi:hypothetical protein
MGQRGKSKGIMTRTLESKPRMSAEPASSSLGGQVFAHAQSGRAVVQDFWPLAESLDSSGSSARKLAPTREPGIDL